MVAALATAAPASADHFGDRNCQGQGATGSSPDDPISVAELVDLFITGPGGLSVFAGQVDEVNMLLLCAPAGGTRGRRKNNPPYNRPRGEAVRNEADRGEPPCAA